MGALSFLKRLIGQSSQSKLAGFAFAALILVCLPRFNGNTFIVKQQPWDARYFEAYVEYFRGDVPSAPIRPASNWRFLLPLLASYLPFTAATSLNLVNLVFLLGACIVIYETIKKHGQGIQQAWLSVYLFIFSFPVFYYGCISYTDPGSVFFVCLGTILWLNKKYTAFVLCFIPGLMAKETVALLLPFIFTHSMLSRNKKGLLYSVITFAVYLAGIYLIRKYAPLSPGQTRYTFWNISQNSFMYNLTRLHTWGAWLLTLGIPGFMLIQKLFNHKLSFWFEPKRAAAVLSILAAHTLFAFSFISTVADGRIIWHSYIFMFLLIFASPNINHREFKVSG